ncbi:cytochrome-c oxidase, cbb3-type subunit III [Arsenicitalea aurantiaca]|uniref:Cbb3-type cytochrome c oxidase subunit n=1 Tax=Arsenicitalea aurantiaca TaxID=1783274 RepID=A0A433XE46_9HYPH|nr:cytochrome-c oxidase, cbb3-type subunit III [Arsenicitalea aurantiaca]RUT32399.1 cytochrome-c oxidase, cbb3-type subunit III [Arsenicitalea aurantiaca]
MAVKEDDPVTGKQTTGHDWNGIKELDTPVPRVVIFFLIVTALFSTVYWILMPAWPLGVTYTRGLLGIDQQTSVENALIRGAIQREDWEREIATLPYDEIEARPELMQIVKESGNTLFGDNCAACHGLDGSGRVGYPDLTSGRWLWGGDPETVEETLRVGINSSHPEGRFAQMPAFGDGMLDRTEIAAVVSYIRSNAEGIDDLGELDAQGVEDGYELYAMNCAACHGEDARGNRELGAPDLLDAHWLYGSDRTDLFQTISNGRAGHMPQWEDRLSLVQRRILALYVGSLSPAERLEALDVE